MGCATFGWYFDKVVGDIVNMYLSEICSVYKKMNQSIYPIIRLVYNWEYYYNLAIVQTVQNPTVLDLFVCNNSLVCRKNQDERRQRQYL